MGFQCNYIASSISYKKAKSLGMCVFSMAFYRRAISGLMVWSSIRLYLFRHYVCSHPGIVDGLFTKTSSKKDGVSIGADRISKCALGSITVCGN